MSYWLLFISAFGAATLLPLQSEAVLITLLIQGLSNPLYLILVATIGNVLGSCVNWWLGLKIEHFKGKKKILFFRRIIKGSFFEHFFRLRKITKNAHSIIY